MAHGWVYSSQGGLKSIKKLNCADYWPNVLSQESVVQKNSFEALQ